MSDSERLVRNIQQASLQVQQWPSWMRNLREGVRSGSEKNQTASCEQQQKQQEKQMQQRQQSDD